MSNVIVDNPANVIEAVANNKNCTYSYSTHYNISVIIFDGRIENEVELDNGVKQHVYTLVDLAKKLLKIKKNTPKGVFDDELGGVSGVAETLWKNWLGNSYI